MKHPRVQHLRQDPTLCSLVYADEIKLCHEEPLTVEAEKH